MNVSMEFISSIAINDAAVKNAASLVRKNSFSELIADAEGTFLGGKCAGSGSTPYVCSVDFIDESSPVFRCTCPSRQIPCKHVLGLLYAYADGASFEAASVPDDILEKRQKKADREEKKKESPAEKSPKKTASSLKAAEKKIEQQLNGIAEADKIIQSMTQLGLGAMDAASIKNYESLIKKLDSYTISGIQNELSDLLGLFGKNAGSFELIAEKICRLQTLLNKSKAYLEDKKTHADVLSVENEIEERIGYPWKITELAQYGLCETDAQLVQLAFHVREETQKKQFVDEGFYINLGSGKIYRTRNYRPFKALKHIKEDDSVFSRIEVPSLYVYPSQSLNPRARWEACSFADLSSADCARIVQHAQSDFTGVIKMVKNQLKDLLLFEHPTVLVSFSKILKVEGKVNEYVILDEKGQTLYLKPSAYCQESFMTLLERIPEKDAAKGALLLLFENDINTGLLFAQPLALVTDEHIIRLIY